VVDWLFRNRETGEITIAQPPNVSMIVFVVAWVLRRILEPTGWVGTLLDVVVTGAIVWWALEEIVRGVNPWRRFLGAIVLVVAVVLTVR
jgi:hypothetical protein